MQKSSSSAASKRYGFRTLYILSVCSIVVSAVHWVYYMVYSDALTNSYQTHAMRKSPKFIKVFMC